MFCAVTNSLLVLKCNEARTASLHLQPISSIFIKFYKKFYEFELPTPHSIDLTKHSLGIIISLPWSYLLEGDLLKPELCKILICKTLLRVPGPARVARVAGPGSDLANKWILANCMDVGLHHSNHLYIVKVRGVSHWTHWTVKVDRGWPDGGREYKLGILHLIRSWTFKQMTKCNQNESTHALNIYNYFSDSTGFLCTQDRKLISTYHVLYLDISFLGFIIVVAS